MKGFRAPSKFVGAVVKTSFGVFASLESGDGLYQVVWSNPAETLDAVRKSLIEKFGDVEFAKSSHATDLLKQYFTGAPVDFSELELQLERLTPFRRQVTIACRKIPIGGTVSYADLARRIGRPNAARAVGTTMATNPWPIVVPCHRVFASGGGIGGYSAPAGSIVNESSSNANSLRGSKWLPLPAVSSNLGPLLNLDLWVQALT